MAGTTVCDTASQNPTANWQGGSNTWVEKTIFAAGLASPSTATVIDNRGGEAVLTDGPYLESKEYLGGFWIIEATDLDVALKLAAEGSKSCNRKVEVRPFLGA